MKKTSINSITILCLIIFITYLCIFCILLYYFFKDKMSWNKFINDLYNNTNNIFIEYFKCPIHSILSLTSSSNSNINSNSNSNSNINISDDNCLLCYKDLQDSTLYKYEFKKLYKIYELFKQIDKFNIYNINTLTNTNISTPTNTSTNTTKILIHQYTMYLWLLENSIKDYDHITNETTDTYYKLIDSYKHINSNIDKDNNNNNNNNIDNDNDTTNDNTQETLSNVENIIYIENNIDLYTQIIYLLNLNNSTIDNFFICKSYYLFSLFTDIYKYIKQINILANSIMY